MASKQYNQRVPPVLFSVDMCLASYFYIKTHNLPCTSVAKMTRTNLQFDVAHEVLSRSYFFAAGSRRER